MSDNVVQFRDFQSKKDRERIMAQLEKDAIQIANIAFPSVFGFADSQTTAFHAPEKDPA